MMLRTMMLRTLSARTNRRQTCLRGLRGSRCLRNSAFLLRPAGAVIAAVTLASSVSTGAAFAQAGQTGQTDLGSFAGDTVLFANVTTPGGTFSSPTLAGDRLNFVTDTGFEVRSFNGGPSGAFPLTRSDTLRATVERRGGAFLTELDARVLGGANFIELGGTEATELTRVTADLAFEVTVLEADGVALADPLVLRESATVINLNAVDGAGVSSPEGSLRFDLVAAGLASGFSAGISRIDWEVTVTFSAFSETNTASSLDFAGFDQLVLTVPEPTSGAVLAAAVGFLGLRRRPA